MSSNTSLKEALLAATPDDPDPRDRNDGVQTKTVFNPALAETELTRSAGAEDEAAKKNEALRPLIAPKA